MTPARLTVVSGPTAVGKGTVVKRLSHEHPEIFVSVSVTTRPPRPSEIDGVHYHFVSADEFDSLIAEDALLEWAVVHGVHRYGTPRTPVLHAIAEGRPALLELDLQGARQVRARWPDARFVFLAPPSWEELVRRLSGRGMSDATLRARGERFPDRRTSGPFFPRGARRQPCCCCCDSASSWLSTKGRMPPCR